MFFQGHMVWGYLTARATASLTKTRLVTPLIFFLSVLPDADIFLEPFGIRHLTLTHTIILWLVLFLPVFTYFGIRKTLPYFFALLQHFLLGDVFIGSVPFLWPLTSDGFGLGFGITSAMNLFAEGFGLALFLGVSYRTGDLVGMFNGDLINVGYLLPAASVLVSFTPLLHSPCFMPLSFIGLSTAFVALLFGSFFHSLFRHITGFL